MIEKVTQLLKLLRHSVAMSPPAQSKGTKARQTNHSTLHLLLSATSRIEARLHTATAPPFWSHDFSDVRPKGSLDAGVRYGCVAVEAERDVTDGHRPTI